MTLHNARCECQARGQLNPVYTSWYDPVTELPFVDHEPGKCECRNNLDIYIRDNQKLWLCSCCTMFGDKKVTTHET